MIETHIEKRSRVASIAEEDIDHDKVYNSCIIAADNDVICYFSQYMYFDENGIMRHS